MLIFAGILLLIASPFIYMGVMIAGSITKDVICGAWWVLKIYIAREIREFGNEKSD